MFRVGQKVVCVKGPVVTNNNPIHPVIGQIYTIRELYLSLDGRPSVRLLELHCPNHPSGMEYGFRIERFRAVVERKTDISIFKEMLLPKKSKINA